MRTSLLAALFFLAAPARAKDPAVKTGIDVLVETGFIGLKGKKVGLISNQTGRDKNGRLTAELLAAATGVTLVAVFSPEHGFTGASEANTVSSTTLKSQGRDIPVMSLYGGGIAGMRPKPQDLAGLDVLIFDIQDIGARFYTYLATMGMALEEAAKANVAFMVLDRPNPLGGAVMEGPLLEDMTLRAVTPTAYFPVPIRHGMTAGEIALMHNAEVRHPGLQVIKMKGWSRALWFDQTGLPWTPPSPNMPDLDAASLYPGIACFEASNISVGRGTPLPFLWIGAPWLDARAVIKKIPDPEKNFGVSLSVQEYTPTKSVFEGVPCQGIRIKTKDRTALRSVALFLYLADAIRSRHPGQFKWEWEEARKMTGTAAYRKLVERGVKPGEILKIFERGPKEFKALRAPYLLY